MLREKELKLLEDLKNDNARKTEEIRQLRKNQLIGQVSGEESITITDGALAFANILEETEIEVEGEKRKAYVVKLPQGLSKQKVRQGYNSAKYDKGTQTISEIEFTHNEDDSMKVNGTSTNYVTFKLNQEPITLKAGTYTLALLYDKTIESGIDIHFDIRDNETSIGNILKSIYMTTNANSWKISEITLEKETDVNLVYYVTNGAKIENQTVKFMLLKGTYTAENLPEYEEYGSSPSIEFPSEIENVRAWNLINNIAQSTSNNGIDFTVNEDKSITLNGTATAQAFICLTNTNNDINNYTNKILTLKDKYYVNPLGSNNLSYGIRDTSGNYKTLANSIGQDIGLIYINVVQGATFNNYTIYPMLIYERSEPKPYAPYGVIPISAENKNFISSDIKDWEEGHYSQTTGIKEPYANRLRLKELIKVQPYTAYYANTFSNNTYNLVLREYDKFKNVINNIGGASDGGIFTTTKDTQFISVSLYNRLDAGEPLYFSDFKKLFEDGTIKPFLCLNSESNKDYVSGQKQNYNLHINDIELNGINDARDSLVIELADENMSDKKIKKLYLKKKNHIYNFTGNETIVVPTTPVGEGVKCYRIVLPSAFTNEYAKALCNKCSFLTDSNEWLTAKDKTNIAALANSADGPCIYWRVPEGEIPDVTSMSNYLKNNETYIIYPLENPEIIDITDHTELVKDVEYLINNFKTFKKVTHVELQNGYIDLEYIKSTELAVNNLQKQIDNINVLMLEGGIGNA